MAPDTTAGSCTSGWTEKSAARTFIPTTDVPRVKEERITTGNEKRDARNADHQRRDVDGAPRALKAAVKSFAARHVTGNQPIFNAYFEGLSRYMTNHISKSTPSGAQNGSKPDHPGFDGTCLAQIYCFNCHPGKICVSTNVTGRNSRSLKRKEGMKP
jgi:hypothetical protein